jgi:uncharacterized small protein (DUF1192 family)
MDDDDQPRSRAPNRDFGAAGLLASESLDSFSLGELDKRVSLLEAEIDRVKSHRGKAAAHMTAAALLFGKPA